MLKRITDGLKKISTELPRPIQSTFHSSVTRRVRLRRNMICKSCFAIEESLTYVSLSHCLLVSTWLFRLTIYRLDKADNDDSRIDAKGTKCQDHLHTIRSVFIIDKEKTIRVILSYPVSTGRSINEILRVIDSLQTKADYLTPCEWIPVSLQSSNYRSSPWARLKKKKTLGRSYHFKRDRRGSH
jgi:hypothetical protein